MTAVSKEAWDRIQKYVDDYPDAWRGGICAYAVCNRDTGNDTYGAVRSGACHYGVSYADPNSVVVNATRPTFNKELAKWLAREAPFSSGVLNRDNEKEITGNAFVIDTEIVGKGGALWLCKANRLNTEDTWKIKHWIKLRELGLNGLQAFIGASILNAEGTPATYISHTGLFAYPYDPAKVRGWYDEFSKIEKIDRGEANRTPNNRYGQPFKIWGSMESKTVKKPDGWGGFTEVKQPSDAKEYAAILKEIFEGDPKNVG